jgi:glycosyltransferase involved in cell wall biosynthesis
MTSSSEKVIAVIPAYNEAATIARVVGELTPAVDEIVVVDDASKDGTGDLARGAGAVVVTHETNTGYETTINDGFRIAAERGATIILTFDADGEHDPADVPRILAPLLENRADIAIGIRPHTRHWSEDIFALYMRIRFNMSDAVCGLKAYRRSVYDRFGFFDSVHSVGTELMVRGLKAGFRGEAVPIHLRSREEKDRSRFYVRTLRGNLKVLGALTRVALV